MGIGVIKRIFKRWGKKVEKEEVECCRNCRYCIEFPKGNKYGDIDYMCGIDGYYLARITADRNKVRRYTVGGKELECRYERKRQDEFKEQAEK